MCKALLISSDNEILSRLSIHMEENGIDVEQCSCYASACTKAIDFKEYAIAFICATLEGGSGIEILETINELSEMTGQVRLPVAVIGINEEEEIAARRARASVYLASPVEKEDILRVVSCVFV